MQRMLIKKSGRLLEVYPTSGPFEGQLVGRLEQVRLKHATVSGTTVTGVVTAVWGLELLIDSDPSISRSLSIGRAFEPMGKVRTFRSGNSGFYFKTDRLDDCTLAAAHLDDLGLHVPVRHLGHD